jgi:tetratricopeptide (TPR) repeat protein
MDNNVSEQIETLIANSRLAFVQGKYQEAFDIAKEVIKVDPNNADAYLCAGNANMSFEKYDEAIKYYDVLEAINNSAVKDIRQQYGKLDDDLAEFNKNPYGDKKD